MERLTEKRNCEIAFYGPVYCKFSNEKYIHEVLKREVKSPCYKDEYYNGGSVGETSLQQIYRKLGQLEDIEDRYRISLEVLIKAAETGIFVKDTTIYHLSGEISENQRLDPKYIKINLWYECLEWTNAWNPEDEIHQYYFSDYGKTWALTKEELE